MRGRRGKRRALTQPKPRGQRLCAVRLAVRPPARQRRAVAGPAHPAATAGLSIQEGEIPRETDCLLASEESANHRFLSPHACSRPPNAPGCLLYYFTDWLELRQAAVYVDKILRGARPADLPVEQPSRFELIVNMKTVARLGLTLPQSRRDVRLTECRRGKAVIGPDRRKAQRRRAPLQDLPDWRIRSPRPSRARRLRRSGGPAPVRRPSFDDLVGKGKDRRD